MKQRFPALAAYWSHLGALANISAWPDGGWWSQNYRWWSLGISTFYIFCFLRLFLVDCVLEAKPSREKSFLEYPVQSSLLSEWFLYMLQPN